MPNETELWYADLNLNEREAAELFSLLDEAERARARRFAFPHLRTRFIAAHAFVRQVVGRRLGIRPECLRYAYTNLGKPSVLNVGEIRFNLSHSEDVAALAVTNREVGVDIERIREIRDMLDLARRFFSQPEIDWLLAIPPERQTEAFFECWTGKEAYLKARGDGLSFPLDGFHVLPVTGSEELELTVYDDPDESKRWRMTRFRIPQIGTGALALEGLTGPGLCQRWSIERQIGKG